ncbi:acyltransferase family protein [Hymenobacter armeniacus]|uniref:Acyltransferase n=1 Tax=Hymenobacter armeniacus TaxID=2771358 RepID=A0ABR8JMW3_9BACT|nr:acyltransferase [Hymenobacter armeniacus]MBD2721341.1 acyltransferase [Hymenobacter armeniacus]
MNNTECAVLETPALENSSSAKSKFNFDLEALRGVAALVVVLSHAVHTSLNTLDPAYHPTGIWTYAAPGHLSVLLFFVLSGYVIGKAHAVALQKDTILLYLKKRFVRIYPIYLVCILFVFLVLVRNPSLLTVFSHFSLTQGLTAPVLHAISPSWSLSYEVFFYLLFIPISYFRLNPTVIAVAMVGLGVVTAYFFPAFAMGLVPTYAFGFAFWLCGLVLARHSRPDVSAASYAAMVSLVFLFLTLGALDAAPALLHRALLFFLGKDLSIVPESQDAYMVFQDFAYLPYCALMVAVFAGIRFKHRKAILGFMTLFPALSFVHYLKEADKNPLITLFFIGLFYSISLVFFLFPASLEHFSKRAIKRLVPLGSISYGLYIVHFPLLTLILSYQGFSGSGFTYCVRLAVFLLVTVVASYYLEKVYQPWVRKAIG